MNKEAINHVKKYRRDYDKLSQRAELLSRNDTFINEYSEISQFFGKNFHRIRSLSKKTLINISKKNVLLEDSYSSTKISTLQELVGFVNKLISDLTFLDLSNQTFLLKRLFRDFGIFQNFDFESKLGKLVFYKNVQFKSQVVVWQRFCSRWGITPTWKGNIRNLGEFQESAYISKSFIQGHFPITIYIGPWTSLEDIRRMWHKIERIQKEEYYKEEESGKFSRDLIWYDLNKNYKLSPRKISGIWIEEFLDDIDLLVIRRIKKQNKELKEEDDLGLLEEIIADPSLKELKDQFEEEKKWYIYGESDRGKFNPPFLDVIKKAIKRFEKKIILFDMFLLPAREGLSLREVKERHFHPDGIEEYLENSKTEMKKNEKRGQIDTS